MDGKKCGLAATNAQRSDASGAGSMMLADSNLIIYAASGNYPALLE
jgi:hypothetical protein